MDICNHIFLHTAYADNSILFSNDELSAIEMIEVFDEFSLLFGKCEVAGIGAVKGVKMALCEMESITFFSDSRNTFF